MLPQKMPLMQVWRAAGSKGTVQLRGIPEQHFTQTVHQLHLTLAQFPCLVSVWMSLQRSKPQLIKALIVAFRVFSLRLGLNEEQFLLTYFTIVLSFKHKIQLFQHKQ